MRRWAGIVLCCSAAMESALRRWLLPAVLRPRSAGHKRDLAQNGPLWARIAVIPAHGCPIGSSVGRSIQELMLVTRSAAVRPRSAWISLREA
jgi:hypothetical protein